MVPKIIKTTLSVTVVSLTVAAVFGLYMETIGIPKTQARNLYNDGVLSIQAGEIRPAIQDFQAALKYWPEPYIQTALNQLQQLSD